MSDENAEKLLRDRFQHNSDYQRDTDKSVVLKNRSIH